MCSVYILLSMSQSGTVSENSAKCGPIHRGMETSLKRFGEPHSTIKEETQHFFVLPTFGDSEAMYSIMCHMLQLKTFVMWDLLDKTILKGRAAILSTREQPAAGNAGLNLWFLLNGKFKAVNFVQSLPNEYKERNTRRVSRLFIYIYIYT